MKTQWIRSIGCILAVLILSGIMPLAAQDNAERYTTISGVVKDKLNKKKLEYVNVSIPGSSVGTVTNADGEFTLKIPESVQAKDIEASHVGYLNSRIPLKEENPTERIVWLTPYANLLSEILVRARDPRSIVEKHFARFRPIIVPRATCSQDSTGSWLKKGVAISIFQRL